MLKRARDCPVEPLSKEAILAAAIELSRRGSVETLSMRQVARHLKRAPMSLYRHVDDVDQMRQMVVAALIDDVDIVDYGVDWRRTTTEGSYRLLDLFSTDPGIVMVIMRSGLSTPSMVATIDILMGALRTAGLQWSEVARAHAALMCLIFGSAVMRRSVQEVFPGFEDDPVVQRQFVKNMVPEDSGAFVNMTFVAPAWAEMGADDPFAFALQRLIDGIQALGQTSADTT